MKTSFRWVLCLLVLTLPVILPAQYTVTAVQPTSVQQGYQGSLTVTTSSGQPFSSSSSPYTIRISGPGGTVYNNSSWASPSNNTTMNGGISIPIGTTIGDYDVELINYDQFGQTSWSAASIFEITPMVAIDPSKHIAISAGPNPVKDKLVLSFPQDIAGLYDVSLHNMNGQELRNWKLDIGTLHQHQLKLQNLAAGHYFLKVQNESFNRSFRIFIQN